MKRLVLPTLLVAMMITTAMSLMTPTARAETFMFPVVLLPNNAVPPVVNEESTASGFATVTLDISRDSASNIVAATAGIDITFSGFPETTILFGMRIHEAPAGVDGPVRVFPEVSVEIGPPRPLSLSGLTVAPDVAQRISNNPSGFYLAVNSARNLTAMRGQLGTVPKITSAIRRGKKLFVFGENFAFGAAIIIDGEPQKTANRDENPTMILIGKKAGWNIAPGQTVSLRVREPNGWLSNEFTFTRPLE